jgi:hypothetical protein
MAKWADYLIAAVQYDSEHHRIVRVRTIEDLGEKLGARREETRDTIISNLKTGKTYVTARLKDDQYSKGAPVEIVRARGNEFIRTDRNQIESDNLGELPEF